MHTLRLTFLTILAVASLLSAALRAETTRSSLDGAWRFALDPVEVGEQQAWFRPGLVNDKWDVVTVPHCFSVDPRYYYFTGSAWYFRTFAGPALSDGARAVLRFDAAFYHATVWLNGRKVGEHEGGYTPFEFDVTELLAPGENSLAVRVNNRWNTTTIPGAKTAVDYQTLNMGQLYPWMNYGGLTRPVALFVRPAVHIANARLHADPDLATGAAVIDLRVFVTNRSAHAWRPADLRVTLRRGDTLAPADFTFDAASLAAIAPGDHGELRARATLEPRHIALWSIDSPTLYEAEVAVGADRLRVSFGIRKIEISGTQLLLNGEPVRLGGANRPIDAPGFGSIDPPHVLEQDLRMMKSAGMELSRLSHYPVSTETMQWADRHGLLIIAEAANWQMTPAQLADPALREKYQAQMREMIERDWNHPALIAWSLGNEYPSETEEGKTWTRDMYAFVKSLDATRPVTFASNRIARAGITRPEDEASRHVDFISANIYGGHLEALRKIHALYPEKPIYISEFGFRADLVPSEENRLSYVRGTLAAIRHYDYVIGASVWTFNDYRSMFPGSNADGYRPWGLVTPDRTPRAMYHAVQEEFATATLAIRELAPDRIEVTVSARADFPRYPLRGYRLEIGEVSIELPDLAPGRSLVIPDLAAPPASADRTVNLVKPGGFTVLRQPF